MTRMIKAIDLRGGSICDFRNDLDTALRERFQGSADDVYSVDIMDGYVIFSKVTGNQYASYIQFAAEWSRSIDGTFKFSEPTEVEQNITYRPVQKNSGVFEDLVKS